jgi:hypothetical protein
LLDGPAIVVSDSSVDLADRGLLSDSRRVVRRTANQLIGEMSGDFDTVKSIVVRVTAVWDEVIPRLRVERARSVALMRRSGELGVDDAPVAAAADRLRDISEAVLSDPLTVDLVCLDEVTVVFDRVEHDLAELDSFATDWPAHIDDARALLDHAVRAAEACAEAVSRANSRVELEQPLEALALPLDIADTLDRAVARGSHDRLAGGADLVEWRRATAERIAEIESLAERCRRVLGERDELRARLHAYSAKAARLGLLEDAEVACAFERARTALYVAPTDIAVASELVRRYQGLLAARGGT